MTSIAATTPHAGSIGNHGAARFVSVARTVAWRQIHNMLRNPALLVPSVVFPLFFFTAFAGGLSAVGNVPGFSYPDYNAFQYVFVLLQSAAFGGVFTGFSIAADYEHGFARRVMLATPRREAIVAGYAVAALTRALITWTIVTTVALLAGMQIGGDGVDLVTLYALAITINLAGVMFAAGVALRFRTIQAAPLLQLPVFVVLFTAPVYTPRELIEGWVSTASQWNPITPVLEAGRGLIIGEQFHIGLAFICVTAMVAALVIFAVTGMRRAEREL